MTNKELIDKIRNEILHLKMKELQRTNGVNTGADVYLSSYAVLSILSNALTEESEDERIRKWLADYFSSIKKTVWIHRDITCEQILEWLEKQKEQKPTDKIDLKFNIGDTIVNKKNGEKCTISNRCLLHQYYSDTNHCHEIKFDEQDDWELVKEQKPNFSEKDSTDFEIEVHEIIAQARNDSRLNDEDVLKQFEEEAAFALMLKANKLIEQQKPAKWSEEDADILNCCISSIEEAKENRYAYKETDGDTSYDREIAFLKSLRPCPSWKPSEEQMEALRRAVNKLAKTDVADSVRLSIMYDNLKKL